LHVHAQQQQSEDKRNQCKAGCERCEVSQCRCHRIVEVLFGDADHEEHRVSIKPFVDRITAKTIERTADTKG